MTGCSQRDEVWIRLTCRCNLSDGTAVPTAQGFRWNTYTREWIGCRAACDQTVAAMGLHRLEIQ
jgi:hypothetical protein